MSGRFSFAVPHPALPRVFVEIQTMAPQLQEETDLIEEPRIVVVFLLPYPASVGLRKSAELLQKQRGSLLSLKALALVA